MKKTILVLTCMMFMGINNIAAYEEDYTTDVTIDVKRTMLDVSVPSDFTMIFNEDGSTTLPDPEVLTVSNNSKTGAIKITDVTMRSNGSGWKLADETQDIKTYKTNTKGIQFAIGKDGNDLHLIQGSETLAEEGEVVPVDWIIPSESSQNLYTAVNRPTYTDAFQQKAYEMVITVAWN